jgi:hypothetical protein
MPEASGYRSSGTFEKEMKRLLLIASICFAALTGEGRAQKVIVDASAEWQNAELKDVTFGATTKGIDDILGKAIQTQGKRWTGFVIFSCKASSDLGKRLLWADADVTFSNGYKREFKGIQFHLLQKGEEFDIQKIPFETDSPLTISEVTIKGITLK